MQIVNICIQSRSPPRRTLIYISPESTCRNQVCTSQSGHDISAEQSTGSTGLHRRTKVSANPTATTSTTTPHFSGPTFATPVYGTTDAVGLGLRNVTLVPLADELLPSTGTEILYFAHTCPNSVVKTLVRRRSVTCRFVSMLMVKLRTVDTRTRIQARLVRAGGDVGQDAGLPHAVAVLVCVRAVY